MWKNHEDDGGVDHTTGLTAKGRNSCRSSEAESGKHRNLGKSSDHQWEQGTDTQPASSNSAWTEQETKFQPTALPSL